MATPTGILFSDPRVKPLSTTGQFQPGCYLCFFATGTTTLQNVFSDGMLTTPLSQPAPGSVNPSAGTVSAADGRFVPIYLSPNVVYRVQMYSAAGILLEDTDPYVPTLNLTPGAIGAALFPQTPAEISALITPTAYQYWARPNIWVRRYGAVLDNITDDTTAFRNALLVAAVVGGRVIIDGFMALASANVSGGALFTWPSNVEVVGTGRDNSGITITGTTETHLAKTLNAKNIRLADLTITGNNQSSAYSNANVLSFQQDNTATKTGGTVCIERCRFTNFKGDYWLWFRNLSATYTMENFWIRDNVFDSVSGNSRGPTLLTIPDSFVSFQGNPGPTTVGLVKNAWVERNTFNCNWKKMCGIAWEATYNIHFDNNAAINCGVGASNSNVGAYAFMAYDNSVADGGSEDLSSHPDMIFVDRNQIVNPFSCGLYVADANHVFAERNIINGQVDTVDGTLPKAAISVSSALYTQFKLNWIDSCYGGIIHVGGTVQAANDFSVISSNRVTNTLANGFGICYRATYVGAHDGAAIYDNTVVATASGTRGIWIRGTSGTAIKKIMVENNPTVTGAIRCIEFFSDDATVVAITDVRIVNNFIIGSASNFGLAYTSMNNAATRARISDNTFGGTWDPAGTMCSINSSYGLTFRDNEFRDMTSGTGFALNTGGARGNFEGQRFYNVATARQIFVSGGEDLGYSTPTWTGWANSYVQNLGASEQGSASSKYVTFGWRLAADGTTWLQQRCLTGN